MGLNRRQFLIGTGSVGLTAYSKNIAFSLDTTNNPDIKANDNSIIYIFLSGGPTQIETFNPIPRATAERRSIVGALDTNIPGMVIGGLWNKLATVGNKYCIVNSFFHGDANHESAQHWMMTGEKTTPNSPPKWPSYGSVICGQYGTNVSCGLPTYIKLNPNLYDGAAWMGNKYMGYSASGEGVKDLMLKEKERFNSKFKMLEMIDNKSNFQDDSAASRNWLELRNQASSVLLGTAVEAFLIDKDPEYDTYKDDAFGRDILTAIRLVEAGVKMVTLNYGGWDMHTGMEAGLKERIPRLDHFIFQYFQTVEKRQLNHKNMLVMTGDFGRTPKINKDAGRDHWPSLIPLFIASDSYSMGRVIGTSDNNAESADQNPFEPEDLKWTMFDHMGINKTADWYSIESRPMMFTKDTAKNILKYS